RSFDKEILGIKDILKQSEGSFAKGIMAYEAMLELKKDKHNLSAREVLQNHGKYLGYAFFLRSHGIDPLQATSTDIQNVSSKLVPHVWPLFWSFRIMVLCGFWFIVLFALAFIKSSRGDFAPSWLHKAALYSLPLPWVAAELGWVVAEYGRQPWAIQGILPTSMGVSATSSAMVLTSLAGFVIFYTVLLVIDIGLMIKYARLGPVKGYASASEGGT
ncbi:MAG: cytochrome ubiquinol oxidase subunit I, partial [Gammaproteobacteria bacterium]|nr:cytochrome ubiquinol oxidase subunit I [Gammaproteobacteria bacterium]